jgi:dTDP-4-dehydrorhamnose reductase
VRLVHVSTGYVFSGRHGSYRETDPSEGLHGRTNAPRRQK